MSVNQKEAQAAAQALQRRVFPIQQTFYEQKNYKQVVKACESALKKDPTQPWFKVYLAMAKQMLGEVSEAQVILESLVALVKPTDLDFVRMGAKNGYEDALMFPLYVQMLEKFLQSVKVQSDETRKLETQLFHAYFREKDFQKAAKQAMRVKQISSAEKSNRYVMWNLVATFWHFKATGNAMSLTLVERMLAKMVEEKKLTSGEDVMLYCEVLQAAGKLNDAVALVEGPLGATAFPFEEELLKFTCKLLEHTNDRARIAACYIKLLHVSCDDWEAWEGALRWCDDLETLRQLTKEFMEKHPSKRGPYLAAIELVIRENRLGELHEQLVRYFRIFGDRVCFWNDVSRYALLVNDRQKLIDDMKALSKPVDLETRYPMKSVSARDILEDPSDPHREKRDARDAGKVDQWAPEDEERQNELVKRSSIAKLEFTLGLTSLTPATCMELFQQYQVSTKLYREHLKVTEEGPNDDVVVLVGNLLQQMNKPLDAAAVCASALANTHFAFQPKFVILEVARQYGAYSYVLELYKSLDIKYVQHDTMGHFVLPALVLGGDFAALDDVCTDLLEWRDLSLKRAVPLDIAKCFQHGKWSQIEGMLRFMDRVTGSFQSLSALVELALAKAFRADDPGAVLSHFAERGLALPGFRSKNWVQVLIDRLEAYKGTKDDVSIVFNNDVRVKQDFSAGVAGKTKAQWQQEEGVVPAEWKEKLLLRALLLQLISLIYSDTPQAAGEVVTKLLSKLQSNAQIPHASLLKSILQVIALSVASEVVVDFDALSHALQQCRSEMQHYHISSLSSDSSFPPHHHIQWAQQISTLTFELFPLTQITLHCVRLSTQLTKSARNKLSPSSKTALQTVVNGHRDVMMALALAAHTTENTARTVAQEEKEIFSLKQSVMMTTEMEHHITTVHNNVLKSRKVFLNHVAQAAKKTATKNEKE